MTRDGTTFRYLTRFQCIGSDCEDHCCGGWRIEVDDGARERLVTLGAPINSGPGSLLVHDEHQPGKPPSWNMRRREDGNCAAFDDDRLCRVQKTWGEDALPATCKAFPRLARQVDSRLEVVATVACPEIARLALLAGDAMDRKPLPPSMTVHGAPAISSDDPDPYRAHFPLVRDVLLEILRLSDYTISQRLFFIAFFAAAIHEVYQSGGHGFRDDVLARQIQIIRNPQSHLYLAAKFDEIPHDAGVAHVVLQCIEVLARDGSPALGRTIAAALAGCETPGGRTITAGGRAFLLDADHLAEVHRQRQAKLPLAQARRLSFAIERYVENQTMQVWFVESSDLFLHQQSLLVRLAALRFFTLGQPDIFDSPAAFDHSIVAAFSTVSRVFDHNITVGPALAEAIKAMGPSSPVHAARLIKF